MGVLGWSGTERSCLPVLVGIALPLVTLSVVACGSDSGVSATQAQEQQATRAVIMPTFTPLPTVLTEFAGCDIAPKAECPNVDFSGLDLGELRAFQGQNLARDPADLTDANLEGAKFVGTSARAVLFEGANLRNANFRGANLREASFYRADVTGADFTDAILDNADFEDAILDGVIYCNTMMKDGSISNEGCP